MLAVLLQPTVVPPALIVPIPYTRPGVTEFWMTGPPLSPPYDLLACGRVHLVVRCLPVRQRHRQAGAAHRAGTGTPDVAPSVHRLWPSVADRAPTTCSPSSESQPLS